MIDYPVLANEIRTDPTGLGYAAPLAAGSDNVIAGLLNQVRATITIARQDVSRQELLEALDVRDLVLPGSVPAGGLAAAWLEIALGSERVTLAKPDGSISLIRQNLNRLVGSTNGSQGRLDALATRSGSRAEQLFGAGTTVTSDDVAKALRPNG